MAHHAQHRQHAVDGVEELRRRLRAARGVGLPQRQQIEQQVDQARRIAADMAAVGQDLSVEFIGQPAARRAGPGGWAPSASASSEGAAAQPPRRQVAAGQARRSWRRRGRGRA
ncbi:MAG: hypothetical protein IPL88_05210 [Rhizobiales bacterium]|nr:hypothetical protein [Hyphomicrobiales bacterium]